MAKLLTFFIFAWGCAVTVPAFAIFQPRPSADAAADAEFEKETLEGTIVNESIASSLNVKARFDAAFSGGEPTNQGFTIPHFYLGVDGVASSWMTYRLSVSPAREYSSALLPNLVPTEAFFRITSETQNQLNKKPNVALNFGLFSPNLNPLWTPDIGELWIPDFFVGQRLLFLNREIGIEFSASPVPDRIEVSAGYFNGNGVFGFNTNNSRALTGFARWMIPIDGWRFSVGGGGFHFTQGTAGSTNYRSNYILNPFVGLDYEPLTLNFAIEGWLGNYEDVSVRRQPKGVVLSLRMGHPRLQGFIRYSNLASTPTLLGHLLELHSGIISEPFPHLKLFLYYQRIDGRGLSPENSVNLRARFAL